GEPVGQHAQAVFVELDCRHDPAVFQFPATQWRSRPHPLRLLAGIQNQRLLNSRDDLRGCKLIETLTLAREPPFTALELTGRAWKRMLHDPDVATILHRRRSQPRLAQAAGRPGAPEAWIGRAIERHRWASGGGGEVGHRGIRTDVDLGA